MRHRIDKERDSNHNICDTKNLSLISHWNNFAITNSTCQCSIQGLLINSLEKVNFRASKIYRGLETEKNCESKPNPVKNIALQKLHLISQS